MVCRDYIEIMGLCWCYIVLKSLRRSNGLGLVSAESGASGLSILMTLLEVAITPHLPTEVLCRGLRQIGGFRR